MVPAEKLFSGAAPDARRFATGGAEACLGRIYDAWAEHYSLTLARDTPARPTWSRIAYVGPFDLRGGVLPSNF